MTTAPAERRRRAPATQPLIRRAAPHGGAVLVLLTMLCACGEEEASPETSTAPEQSFEPHLGRDLVKPDGSVLDPMTRIPRSAPVPPEAREKLRAFLEAMVQPPQDATSDIHDEWFHRTTDMREALMADDEHVGNAALHAFCGDASDSYDARRALLMIGAHAAPDSAAPLFHELTFNYGYRIEDRAEACMLLGRVDPAGYFEKAQEYLTRRGRKTKTMPDDEFLLRAWLTACERTNTSPVEMCADVATNLWMQPFARYTALTELGKHPSHPLARRALETCLIESTGDGMLRIKAAQGIRDGYPREVGCAIFEDVLRNEVSSSFREFLIDMISAHCEGGDNDE